MNTNTSSKAQATNRTCAADIHTADNAMTGEYFRECALKIYKNGYVAPLLLYKGQKRPIHKGWQKMTITQETIDRFSRAHSGSNVGIRTGDLTTHGVLAALDIDIRVTSACKEVIAWLRENLNGEVIVRVGERPKCLVPIRVPAPFSSKVINLQSNRCEKDSPKIELFCQYKQFVAFGIHPKTGKAYRWLNQRSPLNVPFSELPLVTFEQLNQFVEAL